MSGRVSYSQMEMLLELMSREGVLIEGRVDNRAVTKLAFWKQIASKLNAMEGGCQKHSWKWSKMWSDWKNNTKKKVNRLIKKKHCSIESLAATDLTALECKLLKLIGYPKDSHGSLQLPTEESQDNITGNDCEILEDVVPVAYFVEDYNPPSDNEKCPTYCDANIEEEHSDVLSEQSDMETDIKKEFIVENKMKRVLPNTYRRKPQLFLDKEKILQRREELRLRAVELKLKGEELRLQEKEINKVNNLMSIEEEKLKCFKEISASLKELLERTSKGNHSLLNNK